MRVYKNLFNKGFTLVELLVVIAIIAILFAVILIAINPAQRFKDSRNSRRLSDVKSIVEAATTYTADRRGTQLPDVPDYQCVGSKSATIVSDTSPVPHAHWKFDNSASDSLGTYDGTTIETSYSDPAKLDQGLILQNPLYGVSVAETVDNTLTNALTTEGWIKLNQKIEPGVFDHNQALFDKGNYRLQLNGDSGKIEWDIQSSAAPSTPTNEYATAGTDKIKGINVIAEFQDSLYAGASTLKTCEGGTNNGTACTQNSNCDSNVCDLSEGRILKKDSGVWSVSYDYSGTVGNVNALTVYNGKLYSGNSQEITGDLATVYVFDGANWQNTNLGAQAGAADVLSLVRYKGKLYAGLSSSSGASVWEYDGTSWRKSNQFANSDAVAVYVMAVFNGKLYAGTGKLAADNDPRLYEFNGNVWTQKYGAVEFGNKDGVYSLAVYDKKLYIGLGGDGSVAPLDGQVYEWDGASTLAPKGTNGGAYKSNVLALGVYNGTLYAGWSGSVFGDGQIRSWNREIVTPAWSSSTGTLTPEVRSLTVYQGKEYIATRGSGVTHAKIFSYGNNGFVESQKSTWQPNVWYHIAGVYEGGNQMKILINGVLDASQTSGVPSSAAANALPLYLGIGYGSDAFSGVIDDFAVHHSVLSDTDIASHAGCYNLGQYLAPEYMGSLPIDPSSTVTDGTDTGYFISKDTSGVITITAPLTETTSSIPEIIKASR